MKYSSVANPGRRNFFKTGVAATGALLVASGETQAQVVIAPILPPSLATVPWQDDLPVYTAKPSVDRLDPEPRGTRIDRECGREFHQAWSQFPPTRFYEMHVREGTHKGIDNF